MHIDTITVPGDSRNNYKLTPGKTSVVVDVLRVCSTMVNALSNGAERIYPALTVSEALAKKSDLLRREYSADSIILGGERMGLKIEGFDLGNSPLEYHRDTVSGKTLILSSTNGTKAMRYAKNTDFNLAGCFLNRAASAEFIIGKKLDTLFFLSGREEEFSYEDAVGAGSIISRALELEPRISLSDSARMCLDLYNINKDNLMGMLFGTVHGKYLKSLGLGKDIEFCSSLDIINIVPLIGGDGFIDGTVI